MMYKIELEKLDNKVWLLEYKEEFGERRKIAVDTLDGAIAVITKWLQEIKKEYQ